MVMFCKKCGTELKNGYKFCPKCGESYIELNKESHSDDSRNLNDIIIESEKINEDDNSNNANLILKRIIFYISKMKLATKIIICVVTFFLILVVGMSIKSCNKNKPNEICVSLSVSTDEKGKIEYVNGSYGGCWNDTYVFSDIITIPDGKMWMFKSEKATTTKSGFSFVPEILYFYKDNKYPKTYKLTNDKNVPIFRSGDRIQISAYSLRENWWLEVFFVEKDDDFFVEKDEDSNV